MERELTGRIIGCAMRVHSVLGPGLLESAYEACLAHEVAKAGMKVRSQVPLPIVYDGIQLDAGYRLDLLVEEHVVVEIKALEAIAPVHKAQVISYLRLGNYPIGLLINFHVLHLRDGLVRVFPPALPIKYATTDDL